MSRLADYLPILDWGRRYSRATLTNDMVAAIIVTIMLIPQSLAYAMLAGLPAEIGLYASILPLVAYAAFGTSRTLAVGPVAVVSLMTASAIGEIAAQGTPAYLAAAMLLAFLSGAMLIAMGLFKLGFVANFLSHPVISGFITASGLLIAAGQLKYLLGIPAGGHTLPQIATGLVENIGSINLPTLAIGTSVLAFLYFVRLRLKRVLVALGLSARMADITTKAGPVAAVAATILAATMLDLGPQGVALVGAIPQGLPVPALPVFDLELIRMLAVPALLISLIGFVESVSVAQTLAAKRRQRLPKTVRPLIESVIVGKRQDELSPVDSGRIQHLAEKPRGHGMADAQPRAEPEARPLDHRALAIADDEIGRSKEVAKGRIDGRRGSVRHGRKVADEHQPRCMAGRRLAPLGLSRGEIRPTAGQRRPQKAWQPGKLIGKRKIRHEAPGFLPVLNRRRPVVKQAAADSAVAPEPAAFC